MVDDALFKEGKSVIWMEERGEGVEGKRERARERERERE